MLDLTAVPVSEKDESSDAIEVLKKQWTWPGFKLSCHLKKRLVNNLI